VGLGLATASVPVGLLSVYQGLVLLKGRKCTGLVFRLVYLLSMSICESEQRWWLLLLQFVVFGAGVAFGEGDGRNQFEFVPCGDLEFMERKLSKNDHTRIVILSMGSRGDVQPFVALGQELKRRGNCSVVISSLSKYKSLVERYGLEFRGCEIEDLPHKDRVWQESIHISDVIRDTKAGAMDQYESVASTFLDACKGCDVIISTAVTSGFGLTIAEYLRVPCWVVKLSPDISTRSFPPPGSQQSRLGFVNLTRWYVYWIQVLLAAGPFDALNFRGGKLKVKDDNPETKFRSSLGLKPLGGGKRLRQLQAAPTLHAYPSCLVPKPRDWPVNHMVTGGWFVSSTSVHVDDTLRIELDGFLGNSSSVVCVAFGSMSQTAQHFGLVRRIVDTISLCNKTAKVVIVDEGAETCAGQYGNNVFLVKQIPHDYLFPRCSLVVHHGGAGTTARVVQFGMPSIVIPIMLWTDQPLWADRISCLGAGLHVDRRGLDFPKRFGLAYLQIDRDGAFVRRAKALGNRLQLDGVKKSVDMILCTDNE